MFFRICTEYGQMLRISPYSVRMQENADQNNSVYRHFLRSVCLFLLVFCVFPSIEQEQAALFLELFGTL